MPLFCYRKPPKHKNRVVQPVTTEMYKTWALLYNREGKRKTIFNSLNLKS